MSWFFFYDNKMKVSEGIMVYILSMSEALEWAESFRVPWIPKQSVNTYTYTSTTWFSLSHNHFSSIIANMINICHFPALSNIPLYLQSIHSRVYQESTTALGIFQNLWEDIRGPVCSFWKISFFFLVLPYFCNALSQQIHLHIAQKSLSRKNGLTHYQ